MGDGGLYCWENAGGVRPTLARNLGKSCRDTREQEQGKKNLKTNGSDGDEWCSLGKRVLNIDYF